MIVSHVDISKVEECVRESNEWREYCGELAQKGLSQARSVAPVVTGRYRDSLYADVVVGSTMEGSVPGAPAAVVGSTCEYALEVEFQNPRRHKPLLRALDSLKEGQS